MNAPTSARLAYVATSLNPLSRAILIVMAGLGVALLLSPASERLEGTGPAVIIATFVFAPLFWALLAFDCLRETIRKQSKTPGYLWVLFSLLLILAILSCLSLLPTTNMTYPYHIPIGFTFFLSAVGPLILFCILGFALLKQRILRDYLGGK